MAHYTTNSLINAAVLKGMLPTTQNTFKTADFLTLANEELDIGIMPLILKYHEDYLLRSVEVPLVNGQTRYNIPERASGNKLREVAYKDTNNTVYEMTRVLVDDIVNYQFSLVGSALYPINAFYIEGDEVVLLPNATAIPSGSLKFTFYMSPNQLVTEDRAATIKSFNKSTGEVVLNALPAVFTGATSFDIIKSRNPFTITGIDLTAVVNGTTLTFTPSALPETIRVGDYVNLSGETIVPNVPKELHSVLAQRIVCRVLEALNDTQGLTNANQKLAEMEEKMGSLIDNRVEAATLKITNSHGFLRQSRRLFRR